MKFRNPTVQGHKLFGPNYFTFTLVTLAVVGFIVQGVYALEAGQKKNCKVNWEQSQWASRYESNRCFVQTSDGRWLTEENFRYWLAGNQGVK